MEFVPLFAKERKLVIGDVPGADMESFHPNGFQFLVKASGGFLVVVFHPEFLRKLFHLGSGQDLFAVLVIKLLIDVGKFAALCLCGFQMLFQIIVCSGQVFQCLSLSWNLCFLQNVRFAVILSVFPMNQRVFISWNLHDGWLLRPSFWNSVGTLGGCVYDCLVCS